MRMDTRLWLFLFLASMFVTSLVVGNLIGGKIFFAEVASSHFDITSGMVLFPVTFLLTDILNEFYGKRAARAVTMAAFCSALFAMVGIAVAAALPWAAFTKGADWKGVNESSFNNVFTGSQRIFAASLTAYLIGQLLDIAVFTALKKRTRNRLLWLRATGSTVASQCIDTFVVDLLAFYGIMPLGTILRIVANAYAVKLALAIGLTPIIYAGHALLERGLGLAPVTLGEDGEPISEIGPARAA
ncbi:MAG: queuosine precursor transporter [Deltaproteobacteria bacterium]|nr:queuosine precursor transporter [Deltaproteobacteria bacterium]